MTPTSQDDPNAVARPQRRFGRRLAVGAAAIAIIATAAAAAGVILTGRPGEADGIVAPPLPVEVVIAEHQPFYTVRRAFSGRVEARRASDLGFERNGLVVELLADEGDRVAVGDALARLDDRTLVIDRQRIAAQIDEVSARLELARLTLARREALFQRGHSPEQTRDDIRFEATALAAQLAQLEASLAGIDIELSKTELRAPFDAIVTDRMVDEGTVISAGEPILHIIEDAALEARIGLPSRLASRVAVGSVHDVTVAGLPVRGTVMANVPSLDASTRTMAVILALDGSTAAIPDGELARLLLDERVGEGGTWLPLTALSEGLRGLWSVLVVRNDPQTGDQHLARADVEVLHMETDRVFVRGTFEAGDRVVATGSHRLVAGQRVTTLEPLVAETRP